MFSFHFMETFLLGGRFTVPYLMRVYVAIEEDLHMLALEAQCWTRPCQMISYSALLHRITAHCLPE